MYPHSIKTTDIDLGHTSLYDVYGRACRIPNYLNILYRKMVSGDQKSYNALAFKINIPKGAKIEKAVFTCTIQFPIDAPPQYKVFFRAAPPTESLDFIKNCQYKDPSNLGSAFGEWKFPIGSTFEADKEISSDGVKEVLQSFVDDTSYTPDSYFQLVMLNEQATAFFTSKDRNRIACFSKVQDITKLPRLYVEWS